MLKQFLLNISVSLLLLFFCRVPVTAQKIMWYPNLSINDFQGQVPNNSHSDYVMFWGLAYQLDVNTLFFTSGIFHTYSFIDSKKSWIRNNEHRNDNLEFCRLIFDIAELNSRKLKYDFNRAIKTEWDAELLAKAMLKYYETQCNNDIKKLKTDSDEGADRLVINRWKDSLEAELQSFPYESIPPYTKHWFGWGAQFNANYSNFSGKMGDRLDNYFSYGLQFNFDVNDYGLFVGFTTGQSTNREHYDDEVYYGENQTLNLMEAYLLAGYPFRIGRIVLTTTAGLSFLSLSSLDKNHRDELYSLSPALGLRAEYFFWDDISYLFKRKENNSWRVCSSLIITAPSANDVYKGWSVRWTIGIGLHTRYLEMRDKDYYWGEQ